MQDDGVYFQMLKWENTHEWPVFYTYNYLNIRDGILLLIHHEQEKVNQKCAERVSHLSTLDVPLRWVKLQCYIFTKVL